MAYIPASLYRSHQPHLPESHPLLDLYRNIPVKSRSLRHRNRMGVSKPVLERDADT